ncbi:hypothetical protein M407DRAFT_246289 [Tulasnella calospora MUT 4182]|uniref:Uncharacterized protein n=1 Tax=Tulasnella calospora MUT 4182 TaxID=1051891 RepID=A0A0C3Q6S7_9AGAM|nr:hypothetical protein M407DRAFT_246289 [Tulasnella calospora MUT 4182]
MAPWGISALSSASLAAKQINIDRPVFPSSHKDYLFLKKLAQSLPIDSCRFDFR